MDLADDAMQERAERWASTMRSQSSASKSGWVTTVPPFTIVPPMNPPGTGTQRVVLDQSVDFTQWTPEAGIKWQINDEHMAYFRFANGWKSGRAHSG